MKVLSPFSIAYLKCTQRKAGGVARMTTSFGLRQSIAFW